MDWFERLAGFRETDYAQTQSRLHVANGKLHSKVNGASHGVGELDFASLRSLRDRVAADPGSSGRSTVRIVQGDVGAMHRASENASALFQVASQFNLLEMTSQHVTPEDGVTRYRDDHTQGPTCAISAGAGTIYRNYFAPVDAQIGQTRQHQLDGLAEMGSAFGAALDLPVRSLWSMQNGYAMCTAEGLMVISRHIAESTADDVNKLRGLLRVGVHWNVEVTDSPSVAGQCVSQVYCSALPVAYADHSIPAPSWAPFATLVLEAAYEATMWAAVLNARRSGCSIVLLTSLGGGVYGNDRHWIGRAMRRAINLTHDHGLDIRLVSYGRPSADMHGLVKDFG